MKSAGFYGKHDIRIGEVENPLVGHQDVLIKVMTCCLHGIDMCNITPASIILVIGGGMISLLIVQTSKISRSS